MKSISASQVPKPFQENKRTTENNDFRTSLPHRRLIYVLFKKISKINIMLKHFYDTY